MDKSGVFFVVEIITLQLKIGDQMFGGNGNDGDSSVRQKVAGPQVGGVDGDAPGVHSHSTPIKAGLCHGLSHTLAHRHTPKALG